MVIVVQLLIHMGGCVQARKLAAEVYGEHEQGGDWDDDGEWHLVNDGDFDSSDEDDNGSVHSSDLSGEVMGGAEDYSSLSDDDSDDESLHSSEFDTSEEDNTTSDSNASGEESSSDSEGGNEYEIQVEG